MPNVAFRYSWVGEEEEEGGVLIWGEGGGHLSPMAACCLPLAPNVGAWQKWNFVFFFFSHKTFWCLFFWEKERRGRRWMCGEAVEGGGVAAAAAAAEVVVGLLPVEAVEQRGGGRVEGWHRLTAHLWSGVVVAGFSEASGAGGRRDAGARLCVRKAFMAEWEMKHVFSTLALLDCSILIVFFASSEWSGCLFPPRSQPAVITLCLSRGFR